MAASAAVTNAVALSSAASVVRNLHWLTGEHSLNVRLHGRFDQREIDVHGLQPGEMDELTATYPDAEHHRNEDDILKYVSLDIAGFVVTFFRR